MKTKFLTVLDHITEMHFLILQFEEIDRPFFKNAGFDTGLKVVLQFRGRMITCFAGYDLLDRFGCTIDELSHKMPVDGTVRSLKEILHFVNDIRMLPDTVDVEAFRCQNALLRRTHFIPDELQDIFIDRSPASIRKILYRWGTMAHLALFDIRTSEVIYDVGSTDVAYLAAKYLWLPWLEAEDTELAHIELCPFRYERL
ncbi:MAG: hypothetical protein R3B95_20740 [Nitrospirales bacterium]|nr:hypothetical protein [Nitrospirales bacterium]